jgi:hypothetical protein
MLGGGAGRPIDPGVSARTWGKLTLGVLVIGGVFAALYAVYRPAPLTAVETKPPPPPPRLHDARAVVHVRRAGRQRRDRATIRCDGSRRAATGFWARDPRRACIALASTRQALLSGTGCARRVPAQVRLVIAGSFAGRRFSYHAERAGCPDTKPWLAVNVLASPLLTPDQEAEDAGAG